MNNMDYATNDKRKSKCDKKAKKRYNKYKKGGSQRTSGKKIENKSSDKK